MDFYKKNFSVYGELVMLEQMRDECIECADACAKKIRALKNISDYSLEEHAELHDKFCEEVGDVMVVGKQFHKHKTYQFLISRHMKYKIARQKKRWKQMKSQK